MLIQPSSEFLIKLRLNEYKNEKQGQQMLQGAQVRVCESIQVISAGITISLDVWMYHE